MTTTPATATVPMTTTPATVPMPTGTETMAAATAMTPETVTMATRGGLLGSRRAAGTGESGARHA
jgi:hypothetical protein